MSEMAIYRFESLKLKFSYKRFRIAAALTPSPYPCLPDC
jgi:hypothetical protein